MNCRLNRKSCGVQWKQNCTIASPYNILYTRLVQQENTCPTNRRSMGRHHHRVPYISVVLVVTQRSPKPKSGVRFLALVPASAAGATKLSGICRYRITVITRPCQGWDGVPTTPTCSNFICGSWCSGSTAARGSARLGSIPGFPPNNFDF